MIRPTRTPMARSQKMVTNVTKKIVKISIISILFSNNNVFQKTVLYTTMNIKPVNTLIGITSINGPANKMIINIIKEEQKEESLFTPPP